MSHEGVYIPRKAAGGPSCNLKKYNMQWATNWRVNERESVPHSNPRLNKPFLALGLNGARFLLIVFLLAFVSCLRSSGDAVLSGDAFSARFASFRAGVWAASAAWAIAL